MNRFERLELTRLDSAIASVDAAERRALSALRRAGFDFQHISQARALQSRIRDAARANGERVIAMHEHQRRTA